MSIFQSLIKKEVLHLLRDFRTITVVLAMPVVLLLLFGFAISTEVNNVNVVAVVEQHTDGTRQVIDRFRTNSYFTFKGIVSYGEVENYLRKGRADAAVIFRTEDGKLKHQIVVDASNATMAQTSTAYLESVINSGTAGLPVVTNTLYNPQLKSAYNFVPGIMGMIFILICAMMTSVSIVSEKEMGTMNLLLVSPVRPRTIILGKLVPYFLLSCIILILMLVLSYTLLGIPFSASFVVGIAYLHDCLHAGFGPVGLRCDVHDSGSLVVRHDFPGGKHAAGLAMAFVHHSCTLVYFGHAGADDSAASCRVCAYGGIGTGRNDPMRIGVGHKEV